MKSMSYTVNSLAAICSCLYRRLRIWAFADASDWQFSFHFVKFTASTSCTSLNTELRDTQGVKKNRYKSRAYGAPPVLSLARLELAQLLRR